MLSISLLTPQQSKQQIAARAKQRRLDKNYSRKTLQEKSGVSASTIKHFETTGDISLDSLLRIATVLETLDEFNQLFSLDAPTSLYKTASQRKRGRQ